MLKKTLIGFAVVLIVVLGGALIAPSMIDWNARLPEITAQVKETTGRDLRIDGRLEVRLLPTPMLTARGVTLGNAPGGVAPNMVSLDAVEVRVALLALLSGKVQVERVRLVKPKLNIEVLADGRTNLEFSSVKPPAPQKPDQDDTQSSGGDVGGMGVRLDHFELVDAAVTYHDTITGTQERIEGLNTTLRAVSLQGPFEAHGEVRLRGVPLSFKVSLGQIISGRTVPVNALVDAPGGSRAQVSGAVLDMETTPRFKGKVQIEGADLSALLSAAIGSDDLPAQLRQNFAVETSISATSKDIVLQDLELGLAETRATGHVEVDMDNGIAFSVAMKATRINADALLESGSVRRPSASPQSAAGAVAPQPPKNGVTDADAGFVLPKGVRGTVDVQIGAVTYKGEQISDVRLNAELADGELALNQFQLQAPGVTDVAVFGFVKPAAGQPRFNGDLEFVTANPRGLAAWLGTELPQGVASRLQRVTLKTKLAADREQVVLSDINLTGDRTKVSGGVTVALRARPSFGASLTVDALNLDAYANGNGVARPAQTESAGAAAAQAPSSMDQAMEMAGVWAATSALNDFDANLMVKVGSLTTNGTTLKGIAFDGTLYAGALELRQFQVGDALGARATIKGHFNGFGGVPEMTGVQVDANVKDANAVATTLGVAGVPANMGAVTLGVRADGSLLKPKLNATVNALGGRYGAVGRMSFLPIGFGWDGQVSASHPDTVKLLRKFGHAASGPLGALDIKANLQTDGVAHQVTALQGAIGDMKLAGSASASTQGAKPRVVADLVTGVLNIQRFLAKPDKRAGVAPARNPLLVLASSRPVQVAQASSRTDKRWSREAFDLSVLNTVDGELTLRSDAIQFGDYRLDNADIHATVHDGIMTADRVAGQLFGGPVSGTAKVRATGTPTIESTIKLSAMDVGRAVKAVAGKDLAKGNLALDLQFNANGLSPADLVSTLSGAGGLKIDALDVRKGGQGTALAPVIGLVAAMNQFALPAQGGTPKGGLADLSLTFDLNDGVANAQNLVLNSAFGSGVGSGRVDIAAWAIDFAGNMTVEPNLLTSLLSQGRVGRQEVPFSLKGALDSPGVELGVRPAGPAAQPGTQAVPTDPVQNLLQQVLPGVVPQPQAKPQPQPQAKPQPAPQQPGTLPPPPPQQNQAPSGGQQRQLSPEQMIQQLMKGL